MRWTLIKSETVFSMLWFFLTWEMTTRRHEEREYLNAAAWDHRESVPSSYFWPGPNWDDFFLPSAAAIQHCNGRNAKNNSKAVIKAAAKALNPVPVHLKPPRASMMPPSRTEPSDSDQSGGEDLTISGKHTMYTSGNLSLLLTFDQDQIETIFFCLQQRPSKNAMARMLRKILLINLTLPWPASKISPA